MSKALLVELGTEELPPKSLKKLRDAFASNVKNALAELKLTHGEVKAFASPRRLALLIEDLAETAADETIERKGPAKAAAFDDAGDAKPAALGFAKSCGVDIKDVEMLETPKGEYLFYKGTQKGADAVASIPGIIEKALKALPIPKMMRWGANEFSFVRPVHWLVLMFGCDVIPAEMYGVKSGNHSFGHRFHHPEAIEIKSPADYLSQLEKAKVLADFEARRKLVKSKIEEAVKAPEANVVWDEALLDEVTSIVEWPSPLVCNFNSDFLKVPSEALISSMQEHQKCFALKNAQDEMLPKFVAVSNIESKDLACVIAGNEKVMSARLSDAAFFFEQDLKTPLEAHLLRLEKVVFQAKLGSLADKTQRVVKLAVHIADHVGADKTHTERAALLSKTDLMTNMVYEFTDLQGIMGEHYARHQGEDESVAKALFEQYLPRFSGDELPQTKVGMCVALADKLDTLVGIFAIGMKPTGSKDPFALRRQMIGILRILVENKLSVDVHDLFKFALAQFEIDPKHKAADPVTDIMTFGWDRLRVWFNAEKGVELSVVDSLYNTSTGDMNDFALRLNAVQTFFELPEAASLAASNKRVQNILKKAPDSLPAIRPDLFAESAEGALYEAVQAKDKALLPLLESQDYQVYLSGLVDLKPLIDDFFENVMVNAEDEALKNNRLSLLKRLHELFFKVADVSVLG